MVWVCVIALAIWMLVQQISLNELRGTVRHGRSARPQATPRRTAPPIVDQPSHLRPAAPEPPAAPWLTRAAVERWLAEKGLAWIGGSALVIGAAFLVGYAAQRGLFTPALRIAAAALLGVAMIGAAELIRRRRLAGFGRHALVAAILTGAGAAVLYATTWAAYDLYHFIPGAGCAVLLAVIAAGLLGLAFRHGEALAVLALGGAFVAPLISGADSWTVEALTLYLGVLILAGAAIGWLRGWTATARTNVAAAFVWSLLALAQTQTLKGLLLGAEPLAALALLAWLRPRPASPGLGLAAVGVGSLTAALAVTLATSAAPEGVIAAIALPLLVAALQRRGAAPSASLAAPALAYAFAALADRIAEVRLPGLGAVQCLEIGMLNLAALWAGFRRPGLATGAAGAVGSLAVALVASIGLAPGAETAAGAVVACAVLSLGAVWLALQRRVPVDRAVLELWGGSAAAALLLAIATGIAAPWQALGFAGAALGLGLIARALDWRALAGATVAAAGFGLESLLTPATLLPGLDHGPDALRYLALALALAAACFVAARLLARGAFEAEALRTISPIAALAGAFVFLRSLDGAGSGLDPLTEASIRTLMIAVAGLATLSAGGWTAFARWRGHALLAVAALHGLFFQGLVYNPRVDLFGDTVTGPPLLDSLTIAFAAPAALFALASRRHYRTERTAGRSYALVALLAALTWVALEVRRIAHGPHLAGALDTVGPGEAMGGALILLCVAVAAARIGALADGEHHPLRQDIGRIAPVARWIAIPFALLVPGLWSNPCWGVVAGAGWDAAPLAVLAGYAAAAALLALLARDAARHGAARETELITDAAIAMALVFAGLVVRAAFHGDQLGISVGASELEGWSYSALGASFGLALLGFSRRGGRVFLRAGLALLMLTTAKVFIVDTASLSGVVRAGSFLALGALLLLGALTARRGALRAAPSASAAENPVEFSRR